MLGGPKSAGLQLKCQYRDQKILKGTASCALFTARDMSWLFCGGISLNTWGSLGLRRNTDAVSLQKATWFRRRPANNHVPNVTELRNFSTLS